MNNPAALVEAVIQAATEWQELENPARKEASERTLTADNRFTEEALVFAINQQMSLLTRPAIDRWLGGRFCVKAREVGILVPGNIPFVGLQDWLAVVLTGHVALSVTSSKSPYLLPAFASDVEKHLGARVSEFVSYETFLSRSYAVIASGSDDTIAEVASDLEAHNISEERRLLRGHRFSIALIDGQETEDERMRLAEDVLLHEGLGCRNVVLIWAPEKVSPDAYLEAFAVFRSVFPAHPRTPGALKMKQAFLQATGISHAYADGLEFLVSKGEPEIQEPGHIRWAPYETLEEAIQWINTHSQSIQWFAASNRMHRKVATDLAPQPFGQAQRPNLDWKPDSKDTITFLCSLGRIDN